MKEPTTPEEPIKLEELIKPAEVEVEEVENISPLKPDVAIPEPSPSTATNDISLGHSSIEEEDDDDDEDDDELQTSISSQLVQDYRTLLQFLHPDQTVVRLFDEADDIISLFPDLLLYTAPDRDSIGNDPYFDEIEYGRILPFKLSTQRIILQKRTRKRNEDGQHVYHIVPDQEEEGVKILPRHERYDNSPQLSRKHFIHTFFILMR